MSCARLCAGTVEWQFFSVLLIPWSRGNKALRYTTLLEARKLILHFQGTLHTLSFSLFI